MLSRVTKFWGVAAAALLAVALPTQAQSVARPASDGLIEMISLVGPDQPYVDKIDLPVGKSMILKFDTAISEASIGDPERADIVPLTDHSLYVLGKSFGGTNLTLFGPGKSVIGIIDVNVAHDTINLKKRLYESMPGEPIEVRTQADTVMLSGRVSSSLSSSRAQQIAEAFAPGQVMNDLELGASQQVMLAVRFAEVERQVGKSLGISTNALFDDNGFDGLRSSFVTPTDLDSSSFAFLRDVIQIGDVTIDVLLDALEQKGAATILAEPTLIAISGEPASFLAGGEFPVPVSSAQEDGGTRIEIEFKEFGVRLSFTPTVIGDTISLVVEPEVSELDPQGGIQLNNIVIPGLRTRRASTTVELKHGQSFAIAGLMQKNFIDELNQFPGFGSTPILGSLMRSARYQREETELTIIITPYIVEPSDPGSLDLPTDYFTRPHEFELFFMGQIEGETMPGPNSSFEALNGRRAASRGYMAGEQAPLGYVLD